MTICEETEVIPMLVIKFRTGGVQLCATLLLFIFYVVKCTFLGVKFIFLDVKYKFHVVKQSSWSLLNKNFLAVKNVYPLLK